MRAQRGAPGSAAAVLGEWIAAGSVPVQTATVPLTEFLAAARAICQLFLRGRSRKTIEASGSSWSDVAGKLSDDARSLIAIEYLPVKDRQLLVPRAIEVVRNWPDAFIGFAQDCRLSREHFSDARTLQPAWMSDLIDARLAKQNRFVTKQGVTEVVSALTKAHGRLPSKVKVREALGWRGKRYLDALLERRAVATSQEWEMFLSAMLRAREKASTRLHARTAFSRDVSMMIVSLVCGSSLMETQNHWTTLLPIANDKLSACSSEASCAPWVHLAIRFLEEQSGRVDLPEIKDVPRQVRQRVDALMHGMLPDLLRDVRVFRNAIGLARAPAPVGDL